jgi:outer membrane protein OmpA-like peptidoglycan-associated protein
MVTGHTDRLGTHAYNDALSLARARTVRDLLVGQGIDPKRVRTAGAGSRHPVTTQCVGTRATPELVGCLQPDRRVEIEVAGEK